MGRKKKEVSPKVDPVVPQQEVPKVEDPKPVVPSN